MKNQKMSMEEMIEKIDSAKKVNPLDLSSDQDLSIALMNLISLEEHFFCSGGKTGKTYFYDMINTIRDMRKTLMERIVKKSTAENGEVWCISKHLLAATMRLTEVGTKALSSGKKEDAYDLFNKAYDLYSLFWGINMDLIDTLGVKKNVKNINEDLSNISSLSENETSKFNESSKEILIQKKDSTVKRLGDFVRKAVNCCIE